MANMAGMITYDEAVAQLEKESRELMDQQINELVLRKAEGWPLPTWADGMRIPEASPIYYPLPRRS